MKKIGKIDSFSFHMLLPQSDNSARKLGHEALFPQMLLALSASSLSVVSCSGLFLSQAGSQAVWPRGRV